MYLGGAISVKDKRLVGGGDVGKVKNGTFESNELDQHLKLYYIASGQVDI